MSSCLMLRLLVSWIGRWISGERFRKATSEDYRLELGFFFFSGLIMIVGPISGGRFLDHASPVSLWIAVTSAMCLFVFGAIAWARRVPAAVSLVLGLVAWAVFAWLAWPRDREFRTTTTTPARTGVPPGSQLDLPVPTSMAQPETC